MVSVCNKLAYEMFYDCMYLFISFNTSLSFARSGERGV